MIQLGIYVFSVVLVVVGVFGIISALGREGIVRVMLGCVAACVPIAIGVGMFRISGLRVNDLKPLVRAATQEMAQFTQGLQRVKQNRQDSLQLDQILSGEQKQ